MLRFHSPPSVSQNFPVNEPPPGSPAGAPMERVACFNSRLLYVSRFTQKSSPDKRNFTLLSKALGKERPLMFPKKRTLWKQTPIPRALLSIFFGVPSRGAPPPGSPQRAPTGRETLHF